MKRDYVVAVENATGKTIRVWEGDRFRRFNSEKVTQYRVHQRDSPEDAVRQAMAVRAQVAAAKG